VARADEHFDEQRVAVMGRGVECRFCVGAKFASPKLPIETGAATISSDWKKLNGSIRKSTVKASD
jgi:hypothetical protein